MSNIIEEAFKQLNKLDEDVPTNDAKLNKLTPDWDTFFKWATSESYKGAFNIYIEDTHGTTDPFLESSFYFEIPYDAIVKAVNYFWAYGDELECEVDDINKKDITYGFAWPEDDKEVIENYNIEITPEVLKGINNVVSDYVEEHAEDFIDDGDDFREPEPREFDYARYDL